MIKATVGEQKTQKAIPFPKLMIHKDGCIMLFKCPGIGICLRAGGTTPAGYISSEMSMLLFTDFTGSVTLQNEL